MFDDEFDEKKHGRLSLWLCLIFWSVILLSMVIYLHTMKG